VYLVFGQGVVAPFGLERRAEDAAVDGGVVGLEQADAARQLCRDPGEVARLALRRHRRLAQHVALVVPVLLHELGLAQPD